MSRGSTAQRIREEREKYPERFCPKCLWRVLTRMGRKPCPHHMREEKPDAS